VPTPSPEDTIDLPPLLDCDAVEGFLDEQGIGSGPVDATEIGEGHSNVTYRVRREGACVVLRRPPRPPLPPSAHDVLREARVLRGLEGSGVPVPRVLATCSDESLLGVPFYVMEFLDGAPMTTTTPPGLRDPAHRAAMAQRMITALATLHGVDFEGCGLGDLGRPEGYLERQVRRFAGSGSGGGRATCPSSTRSPNGCRRTSRRAARPRSSTATSASATCCSAPRRRCGCWGSSTGRWRRWATRSPTSAICAPTSPSAATRARS
jgi:hypothetical protein